jgi:hypothetical protein
MVEAHANAVEDYLIDGLNFKLRPGASYVTERKNSVFNAIGSQTIHQELDLVLFEFQSLIRWDG